MTPTVGQKSISRCLMAGAESLKNLLDNLQIDLRVVLDSVPPDLRETNGITTYSNLMVKEGF